MLDERQSIGIPIRIIVLNHADLLCFGAVSCQEAADLRRKKMPQRPETRDQIDSTDPANGQTGKEGSQAKAFLQEVKRSRKEVRLRCQPCRGGSSRIGNIKPFPQNLQMRGSSSEPVIFWNQSRNFNFRMIGN